MGVGSSYFQDYTRTLSRVLRTEFIADQVKAAREVDYRASLVDEPVPLRASLIASIENARRTPKG